MRNLSFRSLLIAAAVGSFVLGIVTALVRPGPALRPEASPSPASVLRSTPTPEGPAQQLTVLILGVDSLETGSPTLEAVWLATFRPPEDEVFLFGFPYDRAVGPSTTLRDVFAWSDGPSSEFLAAVSTLTPLPIHAVVTLDAAGFAAVIDFLGGVPTDSGPVDGQAALQIVRLLKDDPAASLLAQARLLQALSARADRVRPGTDLGPLLALVPGHAVVLPDAAAGLTLIAPLLPLMPENIHLAPVAEADAGGG